MCTQRGTAAEFKERSAVPRDPRLCGAAFSGSPLALPGAMNYFCILRETKRSAESARYTGAQIRRALKFGFEVVYEPLNRPRLHSQDVEYCNENAARF